MSYNEMFVEGRQTDMSSDFSSLLTFMIDDIKNFGSRNTSRSLTIILPGTARNNDNFGNIFDFKSSNLYDPALKNVGYNFNAAIGAKVIIFQDRAQVFKGELRLLEIIIDKGVIEYEVSVIGELGGFIFALGNKKLDALDFSNYNLTYTADNIIASWNNPGGSGVYFPHIDYGMASTDKHNWQYKTFRPALYAKEYIDKISIGSGYSILCPLFDTSRFKALVIPSTTKELSKTSDVSFKASSVVNQSFNYTTDVNTNNPSHKISLEVLSVQGNFSKATDNKSFTYLSPNPITEKVEFLVTGTFTKTTNNSHFIVSLYKNGFAYYSGVLPANQFGDTSVGGTFSVGNNPGYPAIVISQNDVITLELAFVGSGSYTISMDSATIFINNASNLLIPLNLGEQILINDTIPKNKLQAEFFTDILKLFNLYVIEDKYTANKLIITPFIDFYLTGVTPIDWSNKMNRDKPQRLKPCSEMNARYYNFKYKDDSDFYNEEYRKRYNKNYGDYIYDSQFEFSNDNTDLPINFSGTPLVGYNGEDKVYSTIFKKSNNIEENIDSNIRILQTKKVVSNPWNILNGDTVLSTINVYGYAGHLDSPDTPSNDLNFGVPEQLYFAAVAGALQVNQFNVYYSSYMAEITDKDSKMLTANFWLTPDDIQELDFSRFIYIDGSLFRINKIEDYNASIDDDCQVELLKVINTKY